MHDAQLRVIGIHAPTASSDYTHTQRVSAQVHAMPGDDGQPLFDEVLSLSRNMIPSWENNGIQW